MTRYDPVLSEEQINNRIRALWDRRWTLRDISILLDLPLERVIPVIEEQIRRTYAVLPSRDQR